VGGVRLELQATSGAYLRLAGSVLDETQLLPNVPALGGVAALGEPAGRPGRKADFLANGPPASQQPVKLSQLRPCGVTSRDRSRSRHSTALADSLSRATAAASATAS
jgi:hypothetical protein